MRDLDRRGKFVCVILEFIKQLGCVLIHKTIRETGVGNDIIAWSFFLGSCCVIHLVFFRGLHLFA